METVKVLKPDAVVSIPIGSSFYVKLKELLGYFTETRTEEELQQFDTLLKEKKEITEDWMNHMTTVILLIRAFEEKADELGLITDQELTKE